MDNTASGAQWDAIPKRSTYNVLAAAVRREVATAIVSFVDSHLREDTQR